MAAGSSRTTELVACNLEPSHVFHGPAKDSETKGPSETEEHSETEGPIDQSAADQRRLLTLMAGFMVVLPVLLQAPWVNLHPVSACLFTGVLLAIGINLAISNSGLLSETGCLLVGLSGSWLSGCIYWGWMRAMPIWHLPIEAIALPLALVGLTTRWRIGSAFYLASLLGTAVTDLMILLTGVMDRWPLVVRAPIEEAPLLLHQTALDLLHPQPLIYLLIAATLIALLSRRMRRRALMPLQSGHAWAIASAVLMTTVVIDGLFFLTALGQPQLSGLI